MPTARRRRYQEVCLSLVVPLLVLSASGCARTFWTKSGFNQADWSRDTYECERDMRQGGYYGSGLIGAINAREFQERCLRAKGYYQVTQEVTQSAPAAPPSGAGVAQFKKEQVEQDQRDREALEEKFKQAPTSLNTGEMASLCRSWGKDTRTCMQENGFRWTGSQFERDSGTGASVPILQSKPATESPIQKSQDKPRSEPTGRGKTASTTEPAERLRQLDAMHRDGLIRDDEYERKRKEIIDGL